MAHWSLTKLIRELDLVAPEWRDRFSDPYDAVEYYGLEVYNTEKEGYSELDFRIPNYGDLEDGFDDPDRS